MDIFSYVAIAIIVIVVYFLFFRNKKAAQKEMNNLSEINYKNQSNVKFDDIAGNYEAKENMNDLVDFMKNPEKYEKFNIRVPKGVLLYGTPGTGKTLLAQALAGEAGVDFYAVSGSDFVQVYAGLGASRIRNLFKKASKSGKSVIFIDEIDAIGKKRMGGSSGSMRGSDESDRTLNALLTEMSGFENNNIIVVAATNRIDTLDSALLRPGRFDRQIEIMLPDKQARKEILKLYVDKANPKENVELDKIAEMTVYFSGAMLENLVNEAKIMAVKEKSENLQLDHLERAYLTVVAGSEQRNINANEEQKKITAYHEAGHAFVSKKLMPENNIVKVSIIPTTKGAGGYTLTTPHNELIITKEKIRNQIKVFLAGRGVEEIFFGKNNITIGAQNDIEKTTAIALDYVTKYGMSETSGLINYNVIAQNFNIKIDIESQIKDLINELYQEVKNIILNNKEYIKIIADMLIENETVSGVEVEDILTINTSVCQSHNS
ncbi:AAA family ATPase [Sedimentibacter sp. zth1]|uniref:AAA family ATPase n=1 Tax=Sedimentibacter sp. zth1 TaxID=2816908 RepID=UPI001A91CFB7|nr:AAA family ATPase [Sedimentibacter sp. zth1]QSX04902.1 AAA family ATPase [Sedimentibacter sp. zth1]